MSFSTWLKKAPFTNAFAVFVESGIFTLWILHSIHALSLPGEVIGATIAVFTLIAQYYWRKHQK